ncbi:uncharacterized protein (DUF697 family) [Neolewinella xylanilytica]|uniref:Uncharacterized protein (DUF697 family) n=1 Tax=Neolewinella xylanilytica TaxID=1514080 RepID=A0A2S6I951_9BACT|nr:DUF697 domain-containing protein [Neolewinella xylanilytica]PPK88015.1 uncharacterized protein (DUF697 family) [Neolewinella xylanilytica]
MATPESTTKTTTDNPTLGSNVNNENLPAKTNDAGKSDKADSIIRKYALFGTATGLIPSFGLDVAALTVIQVKMIRELAELYDYDIDDQMIRTTITTGVCALGGRLLTGIASSITRAFSPLKFLVGGATQAALSGFTTAEIGKIYQARLSSGDNPSDITVSEIVNHIVQQVQEGKWNPTRVGGWKGSFGYLMGDNK